MKYKRIIQLEFNEISADIIESLCGRGLLPNFSRILKKWKYIKTNSETVYENIEPWIQWVTAHTGKDFSEHQVFRLSDVPDLNQHPQIWERLSKNGIESAIIGSMNTSRGETEGGVFFPDPWAKNPEVYPKELKILWQLISHRVQQHATTQLTWRDCWNGLKACLKLKLPISLYFKIAQQIFAQRINKKISWKMAAIFDLFLTEIFLRIYKATNFGFYTLFLNAIAHYQHHYWRNFQPEIFDKTICSPDCGQQDDPITYGYKMYDAILGRILKEIDEQTLVLIVSGLSQVPYNHKEEEGGYNYYRLYDHKKFVELLKIANAGIYPMMSRDWQIKFTDHSQLMTGKERLEALTIKGAPLFKVSQNTEDSLFIETAYTQSVSDDDSISDDNNIIGLFKTHFCNIAIKSGHHTGIGNLWISDAEIFDASIETIPLKEVFSIPLKVLRHHE